MDKNFEDMGILEMAKTLGEMGDEMRARKAEISQLIFEICDSLKDSPEETAQRLADAQYAIEAVNQHASLLAEREERVTLLREKENLVNLLEKNLERMRLINGKDCGKEFCLNHSLIQETAKTIAIARNGL